MKKIVKNQFPSGELLKFIVMVKMVWIFMLASALQVVAGNTKSYSQVTKLDLDLKNSSLESIIWTLKKQSEFNFFYNSDDVKGVEGISATFKNSRAEEILSTVLEGTGLTFDIVHKTVIIRKDYRIKPRTVETLELQQPQQKEISGKVTDANGLPLPGVSVIVKGTTIGTVTNSDGVFTLYIPDDAEVLQFSFVGMQTQEVTIDGRSSFSIVLEEETFGVEEVVVTALGIEKSKKSLSYSTQSVDMEELTTNKDINLGNALAGKVAGVTVTASSGASGVSGDALIIIRGNRSISGGNQPLIVVDGIPLSTGGGGLASINPDDVQNINVLKGPSASALYGSAANNGVIVVTTKRGKEGTGQVEFNSSSSFDIPYLYPEFQNEYAQGANGIYNPATEYLSWGPKMTGQTVTNWTGEQTTLTPQPNNVKDFFRTGHNLVNTFSYSVGDEKFNAYFSYTNTSAQGVLEDNKMQRHNINLRLGSEIIKNLNMDFKITFHNKEVEDKPIVGDDLFSPMFNLVKMPRSMRTADISKYSYIDETGSLQQNSWFPPSTNNVNPYWSMYGYENPSSSNNINSLISLRYDFTDWLYLQARGGMYSGNSEYEQRTYWDTPYVNAGHGRYRTYFGKSKNYNGDVLLSFNKKINDDFNLELRSGAEIKDYQSKSLRSDAEGLNTENKFALAFAEVLTSTDSESRIQKQSVYGMGQLSFRDYLYLDVTARNDWSSTLPAPHSYFYPSVGLTGIISDMIDLPDFFTFAKIRGSYAEVGNDAGWAQTMQVYDANAYGPAGQVYPQAIRMPVNLVPEKSKSWEAGTDLRFFDNRLGLDFTYYKSNTYNQLVLITTVPSSGYFYGWMNCGNIENKGVEIMLNATPVKRADFSWNMNMNFTKNNNTVIELSENLHNYEISAPNLSIGETWIIEGKPYGEVYTKGFLRNDKGEIIVDALGMPKIDATEDPTPSLYLGNFNYDWTSSITNTLQYKNWYMSFLVDLNYGGVRGSATEAMMLSCGTSKESLVGRESGILIDGVFDDGTKNNITIGAEEYYRNIGGRISNGCGETFVHEATNSRLRELSVGYNFPLRSSFVKSLRISAIGRNLFYIYNGCNWFDPDVSYDITRNGQGSESAFLPGTRSLGVNIKLTL